MYGRTQTIKSESLEDTWYFIYEGEEREGFANKLPIAAFKNHKDARDFVAKGNNEVRLTEAARRGFESVQHKG